MTIRARTLPSMLRAAPLVRAKVIFSVKFAACESLPLAAYGDSYCEFDFGSRVELL